jgi:hypothetical protein
MSRANECSQHDFQLFDNDKHRLVAWKNVSVQTTKSSSCKKMGVPCYPILKTYLHLRVTLGMNGSLVRPYIFHYSARLCLYDSMKLHLFTSHTVVR